MFPNDEVTENANLSNYPTEIQTQIYDLTDLQGTQTRVLDLQAANLLSVQDWNLRNAHCFRPNFVQNL